jgi:polysaccharide biosynthesis protein PslH
MNILLISSYLPYPLFSGGQVRLYNLIKELSGKHKITLICEKRQHQTKDDIHEVEKICKKVITVTRHNQWSMNNVLKSGFSLQSFLITGHVHEEMRKAIVKELASNIFDLIHVETFYVMQNLPETPLPRVLVEHNIEYNVYKKFVKRVPIILRPLLLLDIAKIKREEEAAWRKATSLVAVSEEDKKVMRMTGFLPAVVANGVNIDQFAFKEKKKSEIKKILFIGDFSWIQNSDTVKFIIQEIWPGIKKEVRSKTRDIRVCLWIVGRTIPESIRSLTTDPDVIFDIASSTRQTPEIFKEADILLAPIRVGGGTSYKILESMSCGTPVVTRKMSAEAIHASDNEHLMVGRTAQELSEKTVQLLCDTKLYGKIAREGRKLIEEKYTWKMIAKDLEKVYKEAV